MFNFFKKKTADKVEAPKNETVFTVKINNENGDLEITSNTTGNKAKIDIMIAQFLALLDYGAMSPLFLKAFKIWAEENNELQIIEDISKSLATIQQEMEKMPLNNSESTILKPSEVFNFGIHKGQI